MYPDTASDNFSAASDVSDAALEVSEAALARLFDAELRLLEVVLVPPMFPPPVFPKVPRPPENAVPFAMRIALHIANLA